MTDKITELKQLVAEAADRIEQLEAEVLEQRRLNGMGAERELALLAKVERLERENAELRKDAERLDFIEKNSDHRIIRCKRGRRWAFERAFTNYEYPVFPTLRDAIDEAMKP
jgi:hypothetical protein